MLRTTEKDLNKAEQEVDDHLRLAPEIRNALDQAKFERKGKRGTAFPRATDCAAEVEPTLTEGSS